MAEETSHYPEDLAEETTRDHEDANHQMMITPSIIGFQNCDTFPFEDRVSRMSDDLQEDGRSKQAASHIETNHSSFNHEAKKSFGPARLLGI